ncbi:hypothetical protein [Schaalia turicensis]|uniref:hypothetical protein n=1 Tax=Schaalia turicensis TaxID=131111 RepID=UPI00189ADCB5|nr:hypothetical protein [Schaalia turicensis]
MRIALTISLNIDRNDRDQQTLEPEPSGSEAIIEHANHDSTPRMLGFTANTPEEHA